MVPGIVVSINNSFLPVSTGTMLFQSVLDMCYSVAVLTKHVVQLMISDHWITHIISTNLKMSEITIYIISKPVLQERNLHATMSTILNG